MYWGPKGRMEHTRTLPGRASRQIDGADSSLADGGKEVHVVNQSGVSIVIDEFWHLRPFKKLQTQQANVFGSKSFSIPQDHDI